MRVDRALLLAIVLLLLLLIGSCGAAHASSGLLYSVHDGGTITIMDTSSNAVITTIPSASSSFVLANPAGTFVYVSDGGGDQIIVISPSTQTIVKTIPILSPAGMAFNAAGDRLYVAYSTTGGAGASDTLVGVIDVVTGALLSSVAVGTDNYCVAMSPDDSEIWVGDYGGDRVFVLDSTTLATESTINAISGPSDFEWSADGTKAFVLADQHYAVNGKIHVVSTSTKAFLSNISMSYLNEMGGLEVDNMGHVWVANCDGDSITGYSTSTYALYKNVGLPGSAYVYDVHIGANTNNLFVAHGATVHVYDDATGLVAANISTGAPGGILNLEALIPNPDTTAVGAPQYVSFVLHSDYTTRYPGGWISVYDNNTLLDSKLTGQDGSATYILIPKLYTFNYSYLADDVLLFDGASSYVNISSSGGVYNSPSGVYSVELIVETSNKAVTALYSEGYGGNSTPTWSLFTTASGYARAQIRNDAGAVPLDITGDIDICDGVPHRVTFVDNNGSVTLYVDGIVDTTGSYTRSTTTLNRTCIGARIRTGVDCYYTGTISDVRLWTNARSQSQVQQYEWSRLTGSESGLKAYYKLDEGTGTVADDLTANNHDGTITGGVWTQMGWPPTGAIGSFQLIPIESKYWISITDGRVVSDSQRPISEQLHPCRLHIVRYLVFKVTNATVTLYDNDVQCALGTTDSYGDISFQVRSQVQYKVRINKTSQNIDRTIYKDLSGDSYTIDVTGTPGGYNPVSNQTSNVTGGGTGHPDRDITTIVTPAKSGATGNITCNYTDVSGSTTSINISVYTRNMTKLMLFGQYNIGIQPSDPMNLSHTEIISANNGSYVYTIAHDPAGEDYLVIITGTYTTNTGGTGTINRQYMVTFKGPTRLIPYWPSDWYKFLAWMACIGVGLVARKPWVEEIIVVLAAMASSFYALGWLYELGDGYMIVVITILWVVGVGSIILKREREARY